MAQSKTSKSNEAYFSRYKQQNIEEKNRRRKLERQLKLQPNNAEQINLAIKNIRHRRKVPKAPMWSHTTKDMAQMVKQFTGKFSRSLLTAKDTEERKAAEIEARNPNLFTAVPKDTSKKPISMFSIAVRAHSGGVPFTW